MIKSMTGFGRGTYKKDGREYLVEIKSVNHKYCDINFRMPRTFSSIENSLREEILKYVSRGKLDVYIEFNNFSDEGVNVKFNTELAKTYINDLKELAKDTGIDGNINVIDISKMPDILTKDDSIDENLILNEVLVALDDALDALVKMETKEGEKLKDDLLKRIDGILEETNEISKLSTGLVDDYIVKLNARVKELMNTDDIDENRLMQEIVIYSDKCSIEEELTRLKSHINQFKALINSSSPIGKKIDFLIQEMNRETNTIGSKANDLEISNLVIEIKTEIENIREQIQNIE